MAADPGAAIGTAVGAATAGEAAISRTPGVGKAGVVTVAAASSDVLTTRTRTAAGGAVAGVRRPAPDGLPAFAHDDGATVLGQGNGPTPVLLFCIKACTHHQRKVSKE